MPLVDARDLFAVYPSASGGVAALQGLTLAVDEGEICVVLGPSGSGKTTFMRSLAGLAHPSAGSLAVAGLDVLRASAAELARYRQEVLGYADQHYWRALEAELTAEQLVGLPLGLAATRSEERAARARELLDRVGLLDRAGALPRELSGGEQQRIALCAALANRPRLVIADEPTGDLDAAAAAEVLALLAELVREGGSAAVIVSHDPSSAAVADRVVHIRDGRVSEERAGEIETAVIGAGGWLRVPEETLREAGIHGRARVVPGTGSVGLYPVDGHGAATGGRLGRTAVKGSRGEVLEARGVSRRYGSQVALDAVDATFLPGRLTVVVGPSGSGKSTLLSLLAGLDVPDEGEVRLGETVVSALDRTARAELRRSRVAVIGQAPGLSGFMSARESVELSLALRGRDAEAQDAVADALAAVGLAPHADRRIDVLSAGQRERVALARVFAARSSVVVADEPTSRLDTAMTLEIGALLADLAHTTGTTVVCATHDPLLVGLADEEVQLRATTAVPSA